MDFSNHPLRTTVTTGINKVNSTVTTVVFKGTDYAKIDQLFDSLSDLVNDQFKAWYCKRFQLLGQDRVLQYASVARKEARTDKRKYFSFLLKNNENPTRQ